MGVSETVPSRIPKGPASPRSNIPVPLGAKSRENTRVTTPTGTARAATPTGIPKSPIYKNTAFIYKSPCAASRSKSTTVTIPQRRSVTRPVTRVRSKTSTSKREEVCGKQETTIQVIQPARNLTLSKNFKSRESVHEIEMSHRSSLANSTYDDHQHLNSTQQTHQPFRDRPAIPSDNRDALYSRIHDPLASRKNGNYSGGGLEASYDRETYGQLGSPRKRHEEGPVEDVSNLFPRPNTVPLKPQSYLEYKAHTAPLYGSDEQRRFSQGGPAYHRNHQNHQRVPERPTFVNPPPIAGLKYSTKEELDSLLNKYKAKPPVQSGNEYTVYNASVTMDAEKDPDFSATPFPVKYGKEGGINNGNEGQQHQLQKGTGKDNKEKIHLGIHSGEEKSLPPPVDVDRVVHKAAVRKAIVPQKAAHEFPFRETAFGDLVVQPDQIAFESKTLSVLVADPAKVILKKDHKKPNIYDQEILVAQIEDVMYKALDQVHFDKEKSATARKHPPFRTGGAADERSSLADELEGKEIVNIRYASNTSMGTDKLVSEMHQRIKLGRNADTHVVIGNKVFPCHALVIEVYSTYFDNLGSHRSGHSVRRVVLPESEVSDEIFPVVMDWIMQSESGRATVINKTNVVSLFSAAKHLDIAELKSQCVRFLKEKVETNDRYLMNLWEDVKRRPNCGELMSVISAKAAASFQHIYQERQFHKLDVDELAMLLSSDDIVINSELEVYDTAVRWLLKDWEIRKKCTNQVMSSVRFGLLSPLELTQIAHSPEMSKNEELRDYGEVLSYGNVKALIDDGLAFSIISLSYAKQPEKLQNWVESTGIKQPRPRTHLIHPQHHSKSNPDSSQGHLVDQMPRIRQSSSYTLAKDISEPPHHRPALPGGHDETKDDPVEDERKISTNESRSRKNVARGIHRHSSPSSSQESTKSSKHSKVGHTGQPSPLQQVLDKAGQPFKNEDIQSLGERSSRGISNRQRSNSSGRYQYEHNEDRR